MIDGIWTDDSHVPRTNAGRFQRAETSFHNWIRADGSTPFTPDAGRYHLYISLACPWAHRTLIFRKLKGLEDAISLSVVDPFMGELGWAFGDGPGNLPDTVNNASHLHEVYAAADTRYTGRVSVPVLWDKEQATIVNNESSEIIRMFNREFANLSNNDHDFYPDDLRVEIDAINEVIYQTVNNGVYRSGFASSQEAYEEAVDAIFVTLDDLEQRLGTQRYLVGDRITEADWRLFPTLIRFDVVYVGHFKCNIRRIVDYPNLWNYLRDLYQTPGIADTVDISHIKGHYYGSHESINPLRIVPVGPVIDFDEPHDRARFG
jgi:putative glutathione S-transferase